MTASTWTPRGPAFAGAVDGANAYAAALARELLGPDAKVPDVQLGTQPEDGWSPQKLNAGWSIIVAAALAAGNDDDMEEAWSVEVDTRSILIADLDQRVRVGRALLRSPAGDTVLRDATARALMARSPAECAATGGALAQLLLDHPHRVRLLTAGWCAVQGPKLAVSNAGRPAEVRSTLAALIDRASRRKPAGTPTVS